MRGPLDTITQPTMSPPAYYLINHTRKEFCFFENDISIFVVLDAALKKYTNWEKTDDICIDSDDACSCDLLEELVNDAGYFNLDGVDEDDDEE